MNAADYVDIFVRETASADTPDRLALPHWNRDHWLTLLERTEPKPFRTSDVVIQRGAQGRALYLVAAGVLEVGVTTFDGVSVSTIAHIAPASVIGEQSFFDGQPRSANVWGVSEGTLLSLEYDAFQRFGDAHPALARDFLFAVGRILSRRLRLTTIRIRR